MSDPRVPDTSDAQMPTTMEEMFALIQQKFDLVPKSSGPTGSVPHPAPMSLTEKLLQIQTGAIPKTVQTQPTSGYGLPKPSFEPPRLSAKFPGANAYEVPLDASTPLVPPLSSTPYPQAQSYVPNPPSIHPILPKIPCFSGDEPVVKGEVPYIVWRYEVDCVVTNPELSPRQILQIVRSSLRGSARLLTIPLGKDATTEDILFKLEAMYSNASSKEQLMTDFFNTVQQHGESVITYACRLETLLQTVIDKGHLPGIAKNDLLRHKFWTGLLSEPLKLQTRHKYDNVVDYNKLLREIRQVETEISHPVSQFSSSSKKIQHHPVTAEGEIASLTNRMSSLEIKLDTWDKKIDSKINSKFDLILKKLDSQQSSQQQQQHQQPQPEFRYNPPYRGRGRGRPSFNQNFRGDQNHPSDYQSRPSGSGRGHIGGRGSYYSNRAVGNRGYPQAEN